MSTNDNISQKQYAVLQPNQQALAPEKDTREALGIS